MAPKDDSKHKDKPKLNIAYPVLTLKKWKPPTLGKPLDPFKRKPLVRLPEFPHTRIMDHSTLAKIWHRFKKLTPAMYILRGNYSECDPTFLKSQQCLQTAANCCAAIGMLQVAPIEKWSDAVIEKVLNLGTKIHTYSCSVNHSRTCYSVKEVAPSFFIGQVNIVLSIDNGILKGKLYTEKVDNPVPTLAATLKDFFAVRKYCVLEIEGALVMLWQNKGSYYLFDPNGRDEIGDKMKHGPAAVLKFLRLPTMVQKIRDNVVSKFRNPEFTIQPVDIKKILYPNLHAPNTLDEFRHLIRQKPAEITLITSEQTIRPDSPGGGKAEPIALPVPGKTEDVKKSTPSERSLADPETLEEATKKPSEKVKAPSMTYFHDIVPRKSGILRASVHQADERFSTYAGKQSLANAVAAIAMLREHKSKVWIKKILDDILLTGQQIYMDSKQNIYGDQILGLKELTKKIRINHTVYTHEIEETTVMGKLSSRKFNIIDLLPALQEFFTDNTSGVIRGPEILAVWSENERFYMFDPNERDEVGRYAPKLNKIQSESASEEAPEQGTACLTWFIDLKDLVALYFENLHKDHKRDHFIISAVQIKEYVELPEPWNQFTPLEYGKWILRGTISQNDKKFSGPSRNTQCTANATMAIAYAKLKPIQEWDRDTIDEILITGDMLYTESVASLKAKNHFKNPQLMIAEVLTRFTVNDKDLGLDVEDCLINGLVNVPDDHEVLNLKKGFQHFFEDNDACVLTARCLSVGIWKQDNAFFYFDSHSRDEKGYNSCAGTACLMRFLTIPDMTNVIQSNFGADPNSLYNISRVDVGVWEQTKDGISRPKLNNFVEINSSKAIVRATSHQGDSSLYDIHAGKQLVANLIVCLGMTTVFPANVWNTEIVDDILTMGESLYERSREVLIKNDLATKNSQEPAGELEEEPVTVENVIREFKIGLNKIVITNDGEKTGIIEQDEAKPKYNVESEDKPEPTNSLKTILCEYLTEEGDAPKYALIKSDPLTVVVWRDTDVYFLFDPLGRNKQGNTFGRDKWSAKIVYDDLYFGDENEEMDYPLEEAIGDGLAGENASLPPAGAAAAPKPAEKGDAPLQITSEEAIQEEEEEEEAIQEPEEEDVNDTKACTLMFTYFSALLSHIIENIRPNSRNMNFTMYPITIDNTPDYKPKLDPIERNVGNWNNFVEIDREHWILRGTMNMTNTMYPITNRGQQYAGMCVSALCFIRVYALSKFKPNVVDSILKYGDRLHTCVIRQRTRDLKSCNIDLTEAEMLMILHFQKILAKDLMKSFMFADFKITLEVASAVLSGDINAKIVEPKDGEEEEEEEEEDKEGPEAKAARQLLNLPRAVDKFFKDNKFGIINVKQLSVAIYKTSTESEEMFYMFDPASRGPNGVVESNGTACITRYTHTALLCDILDKNLEVDGPNEFTIDAITIKYETAKREQHEITQVVKISPKVSPFNEVSPGKLILSGHFNLNNPKFGKIKDAACSCNALVALAMAHIHKTETWTKPLIDNILSIGNALYDLSKETLSYGFNPWEDKLSLELVNKQFTVGVMHVEYELVENRVQLGILTIKHPEIYNLRRACENLFEHNTHGVIENDYQTCAIWVENNLFYMFDPYARSSTGKFLNGGSACLMVFKNIKSLTDHFIDNIPKENQTTEFQIYPLIIRMKEVKEKRKAALKKCEILKCQDINILESLEDVDAKAKKAAEEPKPDENELKLELITRPCTRPCTNPQLEPLMVDDTTQMDTGPICTMEDKKAWAKKKSIERNKKEQEILTRLMRRQFFPLKTPGDAIVRGHYSQNSTKYSETSRNNQAIPNALISIVMSKLHAPNTWSYKFIDIILDSADVLYKDSYTFYSPKNVQLGLKNVLRKFYVQHLKIHTVIYRPAIYGDLVYLELYTGLLNFFLQQTAGIIITTTICVGIFQKAGQYFVFDPYDRNMEGEPTRTNGAACLLRFDTLENMAQKIIKNANIPVTESGDPGKYSIAAVTFDEMKKVVKKEEGGSVTSGTRTQLDDPSTSRPTTVKKEASDPQTFKTDK